MAAKIKTETATETSAPALEGGRPFPRVQLEFKLPSKTRASELANTDLKTLVNRFRLAGALPPNHLSYGDTTQFPTTRLEAMEKLQAAADAFSAFPLKVRQALNHDPRNLTPAWVGANPQLAYEAGLIELPKAPAPSPANPTSSGGAGEGKEGGAA